MEKFDFKKEFKDLYLPKSKPMIVDVPKMIFVGVEGKGAPASPKYTEALKRLMDIMNIR